MQQDHYPLFTALATGAYMALILFLVIRAARRTKSMADYALGSQGFSPVVVGLSLAAGITSAATFIINPGFVAYYGWSAFLALSVAVPAALFVSLVVLSKSFRKYGSTVKALTLSQWLSKRFDQSGMGIWFAVLSLLLITFLVLIVVGMTKVLAGALQVGEFYVLTGLTVFVFGYMMFGGANSMVYTNAIQAVLMVIVAVLLIGSGLSNFSGGISGFVAKLDAIDPQLGLSFNAKSPIFRDWFEVLFCNAVVGFAIVCQPHIITRSLLLKDQKDLNKYLWTAILVETLFFAVLFVGFYARIEFPDLKNGEQTIPLDGVVSAYVVRHFPVYVGIIVILGLLSAGLSTLEGLIQSVSTTLTNDFWFALHNGDSPSEVSIRRVHRGSILLLGSITWLVGYQQLVSPNVSVGILAQNGVYAYFSAAFVPVLMGIYVRKSSYWPPLLASVVAILTHFSVYYGELTPYTTGAVKNPAVAAATAILMAVFTGLVVYISPLGKVKTGSGHTADNPS